MLLRNQFESGVPHVSPVLRYMRVFRGLAAVILVALISLGAGDNARVDRLGRQVICMCGCNQILLECNHLGCPYLSRMKEQLTTAVDRGDSDSTIVQFFVQTYGTLVLAAPTNQGFDRIAWIMPYVALFGGIALVVLVVWAWRKRRPVALPVTSRSPNGEELARFREQARKETAL